MDIIDIMLARAMTPQGQTETYVAKANAAAAKAAKAEEDAAAAIATVTAAAQDIADAQSAASTLLETAQDALETAQSAQINTLDLEDVDDEIKELGLSINVNEAAGANTINLVTTYPDDTQDSDTITKLYKLTGSNEDGTMTQKAITEALNGKLNTNALNGYATEQYVTSAIANIPASSGSGGSGNINGSITTDDAGRLVVVDENGNIAASLVSQEELITALLDSNSLIIKDAVGLDIDYANRTFTRIQQAAGLSMGSDFNKFTMYGGRTKCNVADDGTINAFYGDNNYTEDGSNGQVMIYQPKFYYRRVPHLVEDLVKGKIIRHESLMLTATPQVGFKLAPIFKGDLDYVLLPAYDGSLINDKLASVAGVTPLNNITIEQAEAYATARGTGWHIMNLAAESTNQMLEIVEFGMMNGQAALEAGITSAMGNGSAVLFTTGSTATLGNGTGHATSSEAKINGVTSTYSDVGKRAICYRGLENPWGHLWQMIGGVNIKGTGQSNGGTAYICTDFNYTPTQVGDNYEEVGYALPTTYKWLNAMGYGNDKYDWVFLPIECSQNANSLLPIGDSIWATNGLNGVNILASGGSYGYTDECGMFYYAADRAVNESARVNYGAKLLYIPTKNATYTANIAKWNTYMGG